MPKKKLSPCFQLSHTTAFAAREEERIIKKRLQSISSVEPHLPAGAGGGS